MITEMDHANEQLKNGQVITFKNYEEFEAMTNAQFYRRRLKIFVKGKFFR